MLDLLLWLFLPWVYHWREMRKADENWKWLWGKKEFMREAYDKECRARHLLEQEKKTLLIDLDKARTEAAILSETVEKNKEEHDKQLDQLRISMVYCQWNVVAMVVMNDNHFFIPEEIIHFASRPDVRLLVTAAPDGIHLSVQLSDDIFEEASIS